jgi:hypothetical protein
MIKLGLAPGVRVMAISTFFTHLAIVYVVFRMAVVATIFCLPILTVWLVTGATFGRLMLACQFKIGESVIELVFVQPDYPGIGTLVITMAGFTIQVAGILVFTMEAPLVAYVLGDRFMVMAVEA